MAWKLGWRRSPGAATSAFLKELHSSYDRANTLVEALCVARVRQRARCPSPTLLRIEREMRILRASLLDLMENVIRLRG